VIIYGYEGIDDVMAKPILPTPPLSAADSRELLASLAKGASDAEMARRAARAQERIVALSAPKPATPGGHGKTRR
jgi:hypothetical protein